MARHAKVPPPRAHWVLLAVALVAVVGLLALDAFVTGGLGVEATTPPGSRATVPSAVRDGGPVLDARGTRPVSSRPPDHTIALTFDDGPDPQWTPQVLAVLSKYHVHATFFMIGANAAREPGLVGRIIAQGSEVANHTWTHPDLRATSASRTAFELRATDLVLAYTAGVRTSLVRLPYSSQSSSVDDKAWSAIQQAGADGKLVVMSTVDSQDWRRPGVDAVVANSVPPDTRGAILLMHDGGGDRAQTVAALDQLIPRLQKQGWRIDTVSGATGVRHSTGTAGALDWLGGALLIAVTNLAASTVAALRVLLVAATVLAALRTLLVLVTALAHARNARQAPARRDGPPVTVIVPAYNEEAGIEATVRSILAADHPVELIVVDDGSTDATAEIVVALALPGVRLIRQRNAGKSAALNTGLAASRTEIVVMVDGDTVLEPDAVGALAAHFADPSVGAVSGNAKVGNRRGLLGKWQHIEYVIGFNLDRRMYDVLECMPTVPGAVGAFRRTAVREQGGVPQDTLAEDTDLTMALERAGWRVRFEERAIAWTEAPATVGQLWKQRYRWCYGTLQAAWKHRHAALERGAAGRLGRRGLPYLLLFQVVLPMLAPVVDVASVFGLLTGSVGNILAVWFGFLVLQAIPGVVAFRLDHERLAPLLALPLQQFVYRQLMYLVVVQSVATAVAGARLPWHKLERRGGAVPAGFER